MSQAFGILLVPCGFVGPYERRDVGPVVEVRDPEDRGVVPPRVAVLRAVGHVHDDDPLFCIIRGFVLPACWWLYFPRSMGSQVSQLALLNTYAEVTFSFVEGS